MSVQLSVCDKKTAAVCTVVLQHLQEFAKINLANLVIWQLAKIYAKLKKGYL